MRSVSELVWSPDEGLSIKIAASSLSTRKASLRWNADTLSIVISSPQQSGGGESGDIIDATVEDAEKMPSQLRTRSDSSARVFMSSPTRIRHIDAQQSTSIRSHGQDSKCRGGMDVMNEGKETSDNFCVDKLEKEDDVGSCPTRYGNNTSQSLGSASRKEAMPTIAEKQAFCATTVHDERSWAANAWRARLVKAISQKDSVLPNNADNIHSTSAFGSIGNTENMPGKLTSMLGNRNDSSQDQAMQENNKDGLIVARCGSASAVNPVARCELASGVNPFARDESLSGCNPRNLEKGKEKLIYDMSNCVSNTNEGDDSNESIESCPSTKAPKRKYGQFSAAEMTSGNKRYRREDNESSCSGLFPKNDSSFFNWMSTLTNGVKVFDETTAVPLNQKFSAATAEEFPANPVPLENNSGVPLQSVGFNSLFQSLYSQNVLITSRNTCHQSENSYTGNRLTHVATGTLAAGRIQMDSDGDRGASQNQIGIFPLRAERNLKLLNSSKLCHRSLEEKQNGLHGSSSNAATDNKGDFSESLWVSRLLPKTSMKLMDATHCGDESDFCAANPKGLGDSSSQQDFNVEKELNNAQYLTSKGSDNETTSSKCAAPQGDNKPSETMASIFAKRLDALRHATTSAVHLAITCDHGMSKGCNHRTSSFVVSYNSHDEQESGQKTHKSSGGEGRIVLWIGDKGKEQLSPGNDKQLGEKDLSEHEYQNCGGTSDGKAVPPKCNLETNMYIEDIDQKRLQNKERASKSMENQPDNKQMVPYGIVPNDACDESSVVFGALQRLRLSRSDIIRWMRSPVMHTTLDGFFLRLRFGKWEEALGGTGYHVARINGVLDKNRLSVTIRNSTCQVDSRFVSNHDFHEDELKAWWSAAMKSGWKLPSQEELNTKLRERELLRI
uniref:Plus3 domain-containing protein n=1 Tax=Oryza punctata TaxID=4537 RepID=A0A0E0JPD8_ORYPU